MTVKWYTTKIYKFWSFILQHNVGVPNGPHKNVHTSQYVTGHSSYTMWHDTYVTNVTSNQCTTMHCWSTAIHKQPKLYKVKKHWEWLSSHCVDRSFCRLYFNREIMSDLMHLGKFLRHFRNICTIKSFPMKKFKEVMTLNCTHALVAGGSLLLQKKSTNKT